MTKTNFHILRSGFVVGSNPCHDDQGKFCSGSGSVPGGSGMISGKELSATELVDKVWPLAAQMMDQYKENPAGPLSGQDVILKSIQNVQGYDGPPKIVDKQTLDEMVNSGKVLEMHRGFGSADQVEQFRNRELFTGQCGYGNGTYTAYGEKGLQTARFYAGGENREAAILRMGLRSDAKIIEYSDLRDMISKGTGLSEDRQAGKLGKITKKLYEMHDEPGISRERRLGSGMMHTSLMEPGRAAAILGYDAIRSTQDKFMVILNRTALVVQQ